MAFSNRGFLLAGACLAAMALSCMPTGGEDGNPDRGKGIWFDTTYFPGGEVEFIYTMKDTSRHGYFLVWEESGALRKQGHYRDGGKSGWFFFDWPDGKPNQEWLLIPGNEYAVCVKYWDESGKVTRQDSCDAVRYQDTTYRRLTHL
jgi:antitoxin component YwqK of YwqJK toxin-antitoxin module